MRPATSRRRSFLPAAAVAAALALGAPRVGAQAAVAEALFKEAKKLMAAGKLAEACPKLAESYRMAPKLGTLLNLATCHQQEGKTASAWAEFTEASALAAKSKSAERVEYARSHAAELEGKLTKVQLEVASPAPGIEVKLDGRTIGSAAWATPVPVDPGEHEVTATAPGRRPWSDKRTIAAAAATIVPVRVPPLEVEGGAATGAPATGGAPPPRADDAPPVDDGGGSSTRRVLGFVIGGAGVIGIGVGSVFGIQTFSKESDSDKHCKGTTCDPTGVSLRNDAKTDATASTIAFAAGGALVVGGLILVLTSGGSSKKSAGARATHALWLAPRAAPDAAAIDLGGRW